MPTLTYERNWINVVGHIWIPAIEAAQTIELRDYDIENMQDENGNVTRESVEHWLCLNTGDFQSIINFEAYIKEIEISFSDEENEILFLECIGN